MSIILYSFWNRPLNGDKRKTTANSLTNNWWGGIKLIVKNLHNVFYGITKLLLPVEIKLISVFQA